MTLTKNSALTMIAIATLAAAMLLKFVPSATGQDAAGDQVPTFPVQSAPALPQFGRLTPQGVLQR